MQGVLYGSKIDYDDDDDDRIYVGDDDADDEDESEDEDDTPPCFLRSARPKKVWVATWYSLLARRFYGLERSGSRLCCGFGLRRRFRIRALSGFRGVGFGSGARSALPFAGVMTASNRDLATRVHKQHDRQMECC